MTVALNELDLAFVVDTTGSMGNLIEAAKRQMVAMIDALADAAKVAMRLGVVEYRDHPPQDKLVHRAHPLTHDLTKAKRVIKKLQPEGGGDGPEAVLAGVRAACRDLQWRAHARRIAVLVGDAPPHAVGAPGDGFPRGCPSGETVESVTAIAEDSRVTVYALALTPDRHLERSFGVISRYTGGDYFAVGHGNEAIDRLRHVLEREFGKLDFDSQVYRAWSEAESPAIESVAVRLEAAPGDVAASVTRLRSRDIL